MFKYRRYFKIIETGRYIEIYCDFGEVKIKCFKQSELSVIGECIITLVTEQYLKDFHRCVCDIIYGKFADSCTPNYDIVSSFIELQKLFKV